MGKRGVAIPLVLWEGAVAGAYAFDAIYKGVGDPLIAPFDLGGEHFSGLPIMTTHEIYWAAMAAPVVAVGVAYATYKIFTYEKPEKSKEEAKERDNKPVVIKEDSRTRKKIKRIA